MSFFKSLFGGSKSKSQQSSQSGFSLLPKELQGAYKDYATELKGFLPSEGGAAAFTPLGKTADEDAAYSAIRGGFAPDAQSLASDISLQMNPFDDYVINDINREAGGDYSILKQALDTSGGFGSNRQLLGANDIDLTRLNQIGRFRQDQYNTALDNALTTLPNARAQDAQNLLGIGDRERGLDAANKQSGVNALLAYAQALGVLPESGGSTSSGYSKENNYGKGMVGSIGSLLQSGGGKAASGGAA